VADSPRQIMDAVATREYQGILLDTPTLIRDKSFDRRTLEKLGSIFPVIRLRFDPQKGCIEGVSGQQAINGGDALACFLEGQCSRFSPRTLRLAARAELALPVRLHALPQGGEGEKTFTLNISLRGCFVFSVGCWEKGAPAWVEFADFKDRTLVPARVSWCCAWGRRSHPPGVGLEFFSLTASQEDEVAKLGNCGEPLAQQA